MSVQNKIASLFFPAKSGTAIGYIKLDCVISDTFTYDSVISDYPIESGNYIQDNIWLKPFVYKMQGIITNTPLNLFNFSIFEDNSANTLAENAFAQLINLRDKKITFDIMTSLKVYDNMVFTKLEPERDKDSGGALHFNAEFKQINKVSAKTVIIPKEKTKDKSYPDTQNTGTKSPNDSDVPDKAKEDASIMYNMFE